MANQLTERLAARLLNLEGSRLTGEMGEIDWIEQNADEQWAEAADPFAGRPVDPARREKSEADFIRKALGL